MTIVTQPIDPVSETWRARARERLDSLTKPLGSLGRLEDLAAHYVAIRQERWADPVRKAVYIFAGDHGISAEGVSAYPAEVTRQMVLNFVAGGAAINVLARLHHAALTIVDTGVAAQLEPAPSLIDRKVAHGTRNFRREPAMSVEQLHQALVIGEEMAAHAADQGNTMIAIGEMGIGNTTAATAITCALTGAEPQDVTGRGTGLDEQARTRKAEVVRAALHLHFAGAQHAPEDILRCVGGFEIAAMTGIMLAAARLRLVLVVDGFIASAAAALAAAIAPAVTGYMIAGHQSQEPGHRVLLAHLGLVPVLSLDMRLGEGTGAVLAMPLIESAVALYAGMATFASANVSEAS